MDRFVRPLLTIVLLTLSLAGCSTAGKSPDGTIPVQPNRSEASPSPEEPAVSARPTTPGDECAGTSGGAPAAPGATGRITFVCEGKLWTFDLVTGRRQVLITYAEPVLDHVWDPRGRSIAFVTTAGHALTAHLYETATGTTRTLHREEAPISLQWSHDGAYLMISPGTSNQRGISFFDPWTGQLLGKTGGGPRGWSPVEHRFAYSKAVNAGLPIQNGGSSSMFIAEIKGGKFTERLLGEGGKDGGFQPGVWAADGTLVYEQFAIERSSATQWKTPTVAWWALPPGPEARPVKLDPASNLVKEVAASREPKAVQAQTRYGLQISPDQRWAIFVTEKRDGIYLSQADLQGTPTRLGPGTDPRWDPRNP